MENKENKKAIIWVFLVLIATGLLIYALWWGKSGSEEVQVVTEQNPENQIINEDVKPQEQIKNETKNMTDIKEFSFDVLKEGTGPEAKTNNAVTVQYKGMFIDGKAFDQGEFSFLLGVGQVVPGFDKGVLGMQVGETRKVYIPSEMGYGARGAGAAIPPNTDLVF